ncbi:hypothetical protein P692DRAFT_20326806 [Suillus brevipes Sb2]|nr:hypothetical protein P692DRAFT_20326806 [Suillus brevipes Sb2]
MRTQLLGDSHGVIALTIASACFKFVRRVNSPGGCVEFPDPPAMGPGVLPSDVHARQPTPSIHCLEQFACVGIPDFGEPPPVTVFIPSATRPFSVWTPADRSQSPCVLRPQSNRAIFTPACYFLTAFSTCVFLSNSHIRSEPSWEHVTISCPPGRRKTVPLGGVICAVNFT